MAKILLTGFEPWADWSMNPSGEVAESLDGVVIGGCEVVSTVLPVVHGSDIAKVAPLIAEYRPVAVVSLGLHGSAASLHVERVAVNLKILDGVDQLVVEGGPDAYFATLPTREMVGRMHLADVPAKLTYSAGTFLCNHIMYAVLHMIKENSLDIPAGFIHLPATPDLAVSHGGPSMALETIQTGVTAGLMAGAESVNVLAAQDV